MFRRHWYGEYSSLVGRSILSIPDESELKQLLSLVAVEGSWLWSGGPQDTVMVLCIGPETRQLDYRAVIRAQ